MEEWSDQGIILSATSHGESGAVVSILTENRGRHAGYLSGGQSARMKGVIEPGSLVSAIWRSRVGGNLGGYGLESVRSHASLVMNDPLKLAALQSVCALCDAALPEREAHPGLFHGVSSLFEILHLEEKNIWAVAYIYWEIAFLRELGFALDLTRCAGGGNPMTLQWISPKSGCAVSAEKGAPYREKLLRLPSFLSPERGDVTDTDILDGLALTGYFLEHWAFTHHSRGLPQARRLLAERFSSSGSEPFSASSHPSIQAAS